MTDPTTSRILVISPWGLEGGYSGPLTFMGRMFSALEAGGAVVDVLYWDRGVDSTPTWVHRAVPLVRGSVSNRILQLRWVFGVRRFLAKEGHRYDIVHFQGFYLLNQLALLGARLAARVVVLPVLDGGDLATAGGGLRTFVKAATLRGALTRVDRALALSERIEQELREVGMDPARTYRLGNIADGASLAVADSRTPGSEIVLGYVGKVGGFKNPGLVLDALSALRARGEAAHAIFVGPFENAAVQAVLEAKIAELGLAGAVEFVGQTDAVAPHLARMTVFVLPSSREGLPGAFVEAMASGLPVVVSDAGSMPFHVHASQAGVVVARDAESIASGVIEVSGPAWLELSNRAADYGNRNFSGQAVADAYRLAVAGHGSP